MIINSQVNWTDEENYVLINPSFSETQRNVLVSLVEKRIHEFKNHVFLLSSGTTAGSISDLKWVALSKSALLASAESVNRHLESYASDIWLHGLPAFHVGGLGIWARAYLSGARVKLFAKPPDSDQIKNLENHPGNNRSHAKWNADVFHQAVQSDRATLTSLVPAQVFDLVTAGLSCPPTLRAVLVGGGALSRALYDRARKLNWPLLPTYGMTETCSQVATSPLQTGQSPDLKILPHVEARRSADGRLEFRGPSLFSAYIYRKTDQAGNEIVVIEDPKVDGWFTSQDRGELNGKALQILGRMGEFVKIGGESVEVGRLRDILEVIRLDGIRPAGIRPVENRMEPEVQSSCQSSSQSKTQSKSQSKSQSSSQLDVALVPVPDERLGHVIYLFWGRSEKSEGTQSDAAGNNDKIVVEEIITRFNTQVLGFEKIRGYHEMNVLPRTSLGKLITSDCLKSLSQRQN